ncbi:class I adenylate-forming enzyme family protein [Humitalea sp. 24SJ18S-53]|uniref:class I adenylate-forming enzyme family protein n=1 Tax=Humitalea sp. 24SJ18S-53 TaxID=3422307 RepID=UPI003D66CB8C
MSHSAPAQQRMSGSVTFAHGIRAAAYRTPGKTALQVGTQAMSFATLSGRIDRFSNLIHAGLGIAPGLRIGIVAINRMEYVEVVCGAAAAGVAVTTVGPAASGIEIAFIAQDAAPQALFVDPGLEEMVRAHAGDRVKHIIPFGPAYEDLLLSAADAPCPVDVDETDVFCIPYTSGSTGRPKGVQLTHRGRVLAAFATAAEHGCYSPDDRAIAITPLFHGAGLLATLTPLFFGASVRLMQKFSVEELLQTIETFAATSTYMIPSHFSAILDLGDRAGRYRTDSLKAVMSGTSPLSQSVKERIIGYFGEGKLYDRYGSTEGGIVSCLRPKDQRRKIACAGQPMPLTRIQPMTPEGLPVQPGEAGEIAVSSPYLFAGYLNLPEQTQRVMKDGWYITGDIGRIDEEGYLYLLARKNDMIISGGENIYPTEIEDIIASHDAVAACAVAGVPHPYWGEAVTAFVVLREGRTVDADTLINLCRASLSRYKSPKDIRFVADLPRNPMGKILRGRLAGDIAST